MEKDVKNMIALKARVAFNGDTEKLIRAAVEKFEVKLPEDKKGRCHKCQKAGTLEVSKAKATFEDVVVENIPVWKCQCGEIVYDVELFEDIAALVVNSTGKTLDFEDLLKFS